MSEFSRIPSADKAPSREEPTGNERQPTKLNFKQFVALGGCAFQLLSLTNTDNTGAPVACMETETPPISQEALDPEQPADLETGLNLIEILANRPTSNEEFNDKHKDDNSAFSHPERRVNPWNGLTTLETVYTDLPKTTTTTMPRTGMNVAIHTTEDWQVQTEGFEDYLFYGLDNSRIIPNAETRRIMECYRQLLFEERILENRDLEIYLSPLPTNCYEDLGISNNQDETAGCDSTGLSLPRFSPWGPYRIFIAPSARKPDIVHINYKIQTALIHEITHTAQYAAGKRLWPLNELETHTNELDHIMDKWLLQEQSPKLHFKYSDPSQ